MLGRAKAVRTSFVRTVWAVYSDSINPTLSEASAKEKPENRQRRPFYNELYVKALGPARALVIRLALMVRGSACSLTVGYT